MADKSKDTINLTMDIITGEAKKSLTEVNESLKETEKLINEISGKGIEISGGDIERVLNEFQKGIRKVELTKAQMAKDITRPSARVDRQTTSSNPRAERSGYLAEGFKEMKQASDATFKAISKDIEGLVEKSKTQSRRITPRTQMPKGPVDSSNLYPDAASLEIRQTQRDKQKSTSRVTSSVSGLERASRTGSMTYNEAEVLKGHMHSAYYETTGASPEYREDVSKFARGEGGVTWDMDESSPMGRAHGRIESSGDRIQELQDELASVESTISTLYKDRGDDGEVKEPKVLESYEMSRDKVVDELQKQQNLREENKNLLVEIVEGLRRLEEATEAFDEATGGAGVDVAPQKGTVGDVISSRANAIALSAVTSGMFALSKSLQAGKDIVERERTPSMEIGMGIGDYDFREIRRDARESGEEYGFKGIDMLEFGQSVMGTMGYTDETQGVTEELARSERLMGASDGQMTSLFETALRSGGVETQQESRDLTDQIKGAIVSSGMVGREDEQIAASEAILKELTAGREASSEEIKDQIALISMLSGTGNKALQGENLQRNLGSLNEGIANSELYSDISYMMGFGRKEEFSGPGAALRLQEEKDKGLGSEHFREGIANLVNSMGAESAGDYMATHGDFAALTPDAIREIIGLAETGELTAERIAENIDIDAVQGGEEFDRAMQGYQDSDDRTRIERDIFKEQQYALTEDSALGDVGAEVSRGTAKFGSQNAFTATAMTVGGGIVKGLTQSLTAAFGMAAMSPGLKGLFPGSIGTAGQFLGGEALGGGGGFLSKMFGGGKAATVATGGVDAAGAAATTGKTGLGGMFSGLSSLTEAGATDILGKGLVTKAVIDTTVGAYKVATADRKGAEAVSQTGNVGGGLAGAWAGMKGGALAGTAVGGPLGTLIGGGLGMLGGGFLGSGMGKGIGDWAAGKWFGGTDEQHEAGYATEEQMDVAESQQEVAVTTSRSDIESRRKDNIHDESENLSLWDQLVNEIRDLLDIAKRQNGIIGSMDGLGAMGMSSGGMSVGGELGNVDEGKYWTHSNLTQHDIGMTSSELTSDQLDAWIADKAPGNSAMLGMGSAFMEAGNAQGIDPRVLVGIAGHESAWGTSKQALEKKNFFGMNANTNSPSDAFSYDGGKAGIMDAAERIRKYYYDEGLTTVGQMGSKYAADPQWSNKVAGTMKGAEGYTAASKGDISINTTVNMKSSGSNKKDGKEIAKASNAALQAIINPMYQQELANPLFQ